MSLARGWGSPGAVLGRGERCWGLTRCRPRPGVFAPLGVLFLTLTLLGVGQAGEIRVGVLQFGTVSWELDTIRHHGLARQEGVGLQVVPLASKSATQVAIQGGAVDVIVTDWIWVSRQRTEGRDYTFVPYSTALGTLMVDPKAGIDGLGGLKGRRLGVAGGPLDKSWLLLRAYSRRTLGEDMARLAEPNFAAPPLLNELVLRGELPAVLNYWHYAARLEAAGMDTLISVSGILKGLGVEEPVPLVGWVFHEHWAETHGAELAALLRADLAAKRILADSDEEWQRLRPLTRAPDEATLHALRDAYRAGIPGCFTAKLRQAAGRVFAILAREGGAALVGSARELSPGTFWKGLDTESCGQGPER